MYIVRSIDMRYELVQREEKTSYQAFHIFVTEAYIPATSSSFSASFFACLWIVCVLVYTVDCLVEQVVIWFLPHRMLSSSMLLSVLLVVAMLCAADAFSSKKASVGGLTTKRLPLSRWMQPTMKNQKMLGKRTLPDAVDTLTPPFA